MKWNEIDFKVWEVKKATEEILSLRLLKIDYPIRGFLLKMEPLDEEKFRPEQLIHYN